MKDEVPLENHHKIIHAHLKNDAIEFTASDWLHLTRRPKPGNMVCLYINGGTCDELRVIFDKLAAGADQSLLDDLRDLPFGSYGHLADQYGAHWFFQGEARRNA
jgi:PhnB protein